MRTLAQAGVLLALVATGWRAAPELDRRAGCVFGVTVVDGDTIKCHGKLLRLAGINAPEIRFAACPAEKALGLRAKTRLEALVASRDSLPAITASGGGYGRGRTRFSVGGEDAAKILIREGLAVHSSEHRLKRTWCLESIEV